MDHQNYARLRFFSTLHFPQNVVIYICNYYRILVIRSNYQKSRQMVGENDNMPCFTFFDTFTDKVNTGLVHIVEFFYLK